MKGVRLLVDLLKISFSPILPSISLSTNWFFIIAIIIVWFAGRAIFKKITRFQLVPVEVTVGTKNLIKYVIERNEENLQIAHRIYIELITRKAAIEIDPENDVIEEIYNSWYDLFSVIRDEIKNIPGKSLQKNMATEKLIEFTVKILNEGLRPHLTKYQAEFRRWYISEKNDSKNENLSPQQIQQKYYKYEEIIEDMKNVNKILFEYGEQLKKLIQGI